MSLRNAFDALATETTLASVLARLPALQSGNAPVTVVNFPSTQAVTGPLTDAQLRAAAVPVSFSWAGFTGLTDTQLRASALPVAVSSAPGLTDAQLRATPVPVNGSVSVTGSVEIANDSGNPLPVSGTFWQATQPVSVSALPLPAGAATETTLAAVNTKIPALGQAAMAASLPVAIASNQGALQTVEPALILTGAAAQTAVVNNILEAAAGATGTDVSNYRSMTVQVVSTGTAGTFIFEQSNDGTNWIALPVFNSALATAVPIIAAITATASAIIYTIPIRCRLIRLRIATLITGGSIQAFSRISSDPWTPSVTSIAQATAGNLNATVAGTVTANVAGAGITGGVISPLTVAGSSAEASSAKVASGNSAAALTNASGTSAHFFINVSAASGTTPTLVVRVQVQDPVSTGWIDLPGAATASITGVSLTLLTVTNLPRTYRLAWVIGGTTPSFTFSVGIAPVI